MKILITGASGFIAKNLALSLGIKPGCSIITFGRTNSEEELGKAIEACDFIYHLAGINRPSNDSEFSETNYGLTKRIAARIKASQRSIPITFASSTQATMDNLYGRSKREGEIALQHLRSEVGNRVHILRLPNVFGKWSRPNYNSVVATFCHNIARSIPIEVHDADRKLSLIYIDDVVNKLISLMDPTTECHGAEDQVGPCHAITVGELAEQIKAFKNCRTSLITERVGSGLVRALYATYLTHLEANDFSYPLTEHRDQRGCFVEFLKTSDSGQFSYFTAGPGITRGGHYHHTKTEKFLVVKGEAKFRFLHMATGERRELTVCSARSVVVETIPGWAHDITNIGADEMIVMLWANEIFDQMHPDTQAKALS